MTSIKNILSLMAAIPTPAPKPTFTSTPNPDLPMHACGEVSVFYTYADQLPAKNFAVR